MVRTLTRIGLALAVALVAPSISAAPLQSDKAVERWFGKLEVGGATLRLLAEVTPGSSPGQYVGHVLSLDQGNSKLPLDDFTIREGKLQFKINKVRANFEGVLNEKRDVVKGTFTQFPLSLRRVEKVPTETVLAAWVGTIQTGAQSLKVQFRLLKGEGGKQMVV